MFTVPEMSQFSQTERRVLLLGKANDNGTYSNDANKYAANLSSPAEYVINNSAQSFLYFGIDPATTSEQRVAETLFMSRLRRKDRKPPDLCF